MHKDSIILLSAFLMNIQNLTNLTKHIYIGTIIELAPSHLQLMKEFPITIRLIRHLSSTRDFLKIRIVISDIN